MARDFERHVDDLIGRVICTVIISTTTSRLASTNTLPVEANSAQQIVPHHIVAVTSHGSFFHNPSQDSLRCPTFSIQAGLISIETRKKTKHEPSSREPTHLVIHNISCRSLYGLIHASSTNLNADHQRADVKIAILDRCDQGSI
jgi:hypothetical protein